MSPRLVLASASPRRAALLTEAGFVFETKPSDVDERIKRKSVPTDAAVEVAVRKLTAAATPGAWVLAADTIIDHDGSIVGKPADELEAHAMLRMFSGGEHSVITGIALQPPEGDRITGFAQTKVTFHELTDAQIDEYIRTGDPMDKAGAYGIQSIRAKKFISKVDGPLDNVIGLPMDTVRTMLANTGFPLPARKV